MNDSHSPLNSKMRFQKNHQEYANKLVGKQTTLKNFGKSGLKF